MTPPVSWRFLSLAFVAVLIVFLLAYSRSFRVLPASDDWPIVVEIHRGNAQGVGAFFTDSVIRIGYRPLKSLVIWAFGNLGESDGQKMAWIRAATLGTAMFYAVVAVLWARAVPLGKAGAGVAIAVMLLHPVLPQAVGSVDSVDTLASSALLWMGAWFLCRWRDRLAIALPASLACFVIGLGFKENLYALAALSVLTVIWFWEKRPRRNATLVGAAFVITATGMILLRLLVIRGGLAPGGEMIRLQPAQIAENTALFATGLLFVGNSVWVFVHRSPAVLAIAALSCLAALGLVGGGIVMRLTGQEAEIQPDRSPRKWPAFLLFGLAIASFPTILLYHVSEMYVPPMLLPFALLCGLAADGFARAGAPARALATTASIVALASSLFTIRAKIDGLVDVGTRAQRQLQQIVSLLPADAKDMTVAIRFLRSDRKPRDLYAVFRMPDHLLLVHRNVLEWARPHRGLVLDADTVDSFSEVDPSRFDLTLGWNASERKFFRIE